MNTLLWVLQILLAVVFAGAGLVKLIRSRDDLAGMLGDWVDSVPALPLKLLGAAELAAAAALVVPPSLGGPSVLVPLAAIGLMLVMLGAIVIHARRSEFPNVAFSFLVAVIAAAVAWSRFGPYAF